MKSVKSVHFSMRCEYLIVSLICILGFVFYLWILTRHPLIYGIDGPYYLIQVESLLETGSLEHGDPPLAFLIFALFTVLLRGDTTFGVRVGVSLFSAISAVPLYFLVKRIAHMKMAGYAAMLTSIFATPHTRMINDLLKNAVGVCFLLFFVYYLHELVFGEGTRRNLLLASLFLVLTGATHILDFGVALLFLGLYLSVAVLLDVNRRLVVKNLGAMFLVVGLFVIAAFAAFPSLFTDFFKGLYFLQDLFAALGETAHPILFLFDPRGGALIMPILAIGFLLAVYEWRAGNKEAALALMAVALIGLGLSFPLIPSEWLWRFLLMEFIPIAFILGYCVSKMERKVAVTIFLLIAVFPVVIQGVEASRMMGPIINEKGYRELKAMKDVLPSDSVVVVEPRFMYWAEYILECDIAKRPSPSLWQSYTHVLGLFSKAKQPPFPIARVLFNGEVFILIEMRAAFPP
ncbi:MAG: glycosyltransferase family 39 protein [Candidatus Bathyarchaeia archaeon]